MADKNIIHSSVATTSKFHPVIMQGMQEREFEIVKAHLIQGLIPEFSSSGKISIEKREEFHKTEYVASVAVLSVAEYKRLKQIEKELIELLEEKNK